MEFHYHKPEQRALNPAPQGYHPPYPGQYAQPPAQGQQVPPPQQNPNYAPVQQQHPVAMGQTTDNSTQNESTKWKTAALWIGGVIAATVISYYVQKALRAGDDYRRNRREANEGDGEASEKPSKPEEVKFVLPNDGTGKVIDDLQKDNRRLTERLENLEHFITSQKTRGNLGGK